MPKGFTFIPKFKLIVDHLKAVRTLDEYVNGAGLRGPAGAANAAAGTAVPGTAS
jgi:hypothetical protein